MQGEDQSIPSSHHASETEDVVSWVMMFVSMLLMLEAAYFVIGPLFLMVLFASTHCSGPVQDETVLLHVLALC